MAVKNVRQRLPVAPLEQPVGDQSTHFSLLLTQGGRGFMHQSVCYLLSSPNETGWADERDDGHTREKRFHPQNLAPVPRRQPYLMHAWITQRWRSMPKYSILCLTSCRDNVTPELSLCVVVVSSFSLQKDYLAKMHTDLDFVSEALGRDAPSFGRGARWTLQENHFTVHRTHPFVFHSSFCDEYCGQRFRCIEQGWSRCSS